MPWLVGALKTLQDGSRKHYGGELMRTVARRLNGEDIAAVSSLATRVP
jgi:cytochrome c553